METDFTRADVALVQRGLAASREKAQALIRSGLATVNGKAIARPSQRIAPDDSLAVAGQLLPYVSRGGLKLEKALTRFGVDVQGRVCLDIGASTGGFTDVLLQNGARLVYAVDVGVNQLDPRLAEDPRVVSMERVNARALSADMFPQAPTLAVMDVSFISIRLILPAALPILGEGGRMIALIKPQFEAGRRAVGKGGIVSGADAHRGVLRAIADFVPTLGWSLAGLDYSPIAGGDGNLEFLADLRPSATRPGSITEADIDSVVLQAHKSLARR